MVDAVAFPVIPTLDEPDSDTGSTRDTRMTMFPDHGGLDRQDRLLVLRARLSDIAIVVRLGCRMRPSKARVYPWRSAAWGTGWSALRAHAGATESGAPSPSDTLSKSAESSTARSVWGAMDTVRRSPVMASASAGCRPPRPCSVASRELWCSRNVVPAAATVWRSARSWPRARCACSSRSPPSAHVPFRPEPRPPATSFHVPSSRGAGVSRGGQSEPLIGDTTVITALFADSASQILRPSCPRFDLADDCGQGERVRRTKGYVVKVVVIGGRG
jgi:hypothetical protein